MSREELEIFVDTFKTYILGSRSEQIETIKLKNKKKYENVALSIFCPRGRKKHALR